MDKILIASKHIPLGLFMKKIYEEDCLNFYVVFISSIALSHDCRNNLMNTFTNINAKSFHR